ncbi:MAG: hypothetical protein MI723_03480, partial [Caulobacterales bacterium]|nr:hypothetical protein [Caulobacterales bacterium]
MTALVGELGRSLAGVWRLIRGDADFPSYFDVSTAGFWRSFAAAAFALPIYLFILAARGHALEAMGGPAGGSGPSPWFDALVYPLVWLHFPVVAGALVLLVDRPRGFVPWVVVHNWTVFGLIALQGSFWLLYLNGFLPPEGPAALIWRVYLPLSLFVHWRVATRALDVPWGVGAGLACA